MANTYKLFMNSLQTHSKQFVNHSKHLHTLYEQFTNTQ